MSEALDGNAEVIAQLRQELLRLKNVRYVEWHMHPNDMHSFRIGLTDQGEIPGIIWDQFPPNLWGFIIDLKTHSKKWAYYHRVGNCLFNWHMGHWRRICGGFNPLFDPETEHWDVEKEDRVMTLGTEGFPNVRKYDEWEAMA